MSDQFLFESLAPPDRDDLAEMLGWADGNLSPEIDADLSLNVLT